MTSKWNTKWNTLKFNWTKLYTETTKMEQSDKQVKTSNNKLKHNWKKWQNCNNWKLLKQRSYLHYFHVIDLQNPGVETFMKNSKKRSRLLHPHHRPKAKIAICCYTIANTWFSEEPQCRPLWRSMGALGPSMASLDPRWAPLGPQLPPGSGPTEQKIRLLKRK